MDDSVLECLRGVPDGVELVTNGTFAGVADSTDIITLPGFRAYGSPTVREINGERIKITNTGNSQGVLLTVGGFTAGDRAVLRCTSGGILGTTGLYAPASGDISTVSGVVDREITLAGTELLIYFRVPNDLVGTTYYDNISVQKLQPATFTLLDQTYMGVGSGEIATGSVHDILTCRVTTQGLYMSDSAGEKRIVQSTDVTSYPRVAATWSKDAIITRIVQTKADGSQFRVGYQIIGVNASIQWGTWTNFDGSMDPLSILKMFYSATTPNWKQLVALSNKSLSDAEIAKVFNYV